MRVSFIIIASALLIACTGPDSYPEDIHRYVESPAPGDWECKDEIARAKADIKKGKLVFMHEVGFLYGFIRHEDEVRQLCKEMGIGFEIDARSCIIFEGQTEGCYAAIMDNELTKRYGLEFREEIYQKADSLYLQNVVIEKRVVDYYDCDERPVCESTFNSRIKVDHFPIKMEKGTGVLGPFIDFSFNIELDGSIHDFSTYHFVPGDSANIGYESQLFELAVAHMKNENPLWVPGKIKSIPVRTAHTVRLFFRNN